MKGCAIEVKGLSKRFGQSFAVKDLSFVAEPGKVTGFLGPNGAGKSTTLRVLLGLMFADSGTATFDGIEYTRIPDPARKVGVLLDDWTFHPARTGFAHLRTIALAAGLDASAPDRALKEVDLTDAAKKRVGHYSTGMRQRLSLATALLGQPSTLVLDEPANGLDPAGIRWLRQLLRDFASDGGTVVVSSHVLAEVSQTVDDVIVIDSGRLVLAEPMGHLMRRMSEGMEVRSSQADKLTHLLRERAVTVAPVDNERLLVSEEAIQTVVAIAGEHGIPINEITPRSKTLEDIFFDLTEHGSS